MFRDAPENHGCWDWLELVVGFLIGVVLMLASIGAGVKEVYVVLVMYSALAVLSCLPMGYWKGGTLTKYVVVIGGLIFGGALG